MASPEQWETLKKRLAKLGVTNELLDEKFILGSGAGGQKINKTSSCVQLRFGDVEIKCQTHRSREMNRYDARVELCDRLQAAKQSVQFEKKQAREKKRRQNRQRSKAQKSRMLDDKKKRSLKKGSRGRVRGD